MIGGVELNPGLGSTTEEEISPMEIEDCSQDAFVLSSQTLQRTPISSQVVPLNDLDVLSQCSSDTPMTPEKGFSTPKSRKRKGYRARNDRNRAAIKKRRSDDAEFSKICLFLLWMSPFRKAVVLEKEKLVSTNVSNSDFVKQVLSYLKLLFTIIIL